MSHASDERARRFADARSRWPAWVRLGQRVEIDIPFDPHTSIGIITSLNTNKPDHVIVETADGTRHAINRSWLRPVEE